MIISELIKCLERALEAQGDVEVVAPFPPGPTGSGDWDSIEEVSETEDGRVLLS